MSARLIAIILLAVFISGCGIKYAHYMENDKDLQKIVGNKYYAKCNLHYRKYTYDPPASPVYKMNSVNQQFGEVIPWGTAFTVERIAITTIYLRDETGRKYHYTMHGRTLKHVKPTTHFFNFFTKNQQEVVDSYNALGPMDRKGADLAKPLVGMSKQGLLVALGPQPEFMSYQPMKAAKWTYWDAINDQFIVYFGPDNKVIRIVD